MYGLVVWTSVISVKACFQMFLSLRHVSLLKEIEYLEVIINKQLFSKISSVKIFVRVEKILVEYVFFGKIIVSDIFFR